MSGGSALPPAVGAGSEEFACRPLARGPGLVLGALLAIVLVGFGIVALVGLGILPASSGPPAGLPFWPLFPLGLLAIFLAVRWLWWRSWWVGGSQRSGWSHPEPGRARAILEERYARGEISREELREMRRDLS